MKRRDFLGKVVWTLTALGIGEAGWLRLGDRYYQALAQPTPRKLALLVGINQYPNTQALSGCLTDVELQRELLIHRFGFKAGDIITLTEAQATRQQIETAFLEHLTKQAQPGDVVVFHFSGYGRQLKLSQESATPQTPNPKPRTLNSLVPVDDVEQTPEALVVNDLLEETLWLMLRSLSTDHVITVLDTSFNAPSAPLQGSLRIRSHPQAVQGQLTEAELAFQQQLRQSKLKAQKTPLPGVVLAAAGTTHLATETHWGGFDAGLFTYILTQYLWEATPATTVQVSLSRVTGVVEQLVGKEQQPQMSEPKSQQQSELAYYLMPQTFIGADGVVTAVEDDGKTARLWLAGIPPTVLEYYAVNSRLAVVTPTVKSEDSGATGTKQEAQAEENPSLQLQMRSRKGLKAKAQVKSEDSTSSLQVGQLVHEVVRVLPHHIGLNIALDPSLERIERVDATSAFAAIPYVSSVSAWEQPADYLFGRVQNEQQDLPATSSSNSSPTRYGLFSLGQELIPNTAGEAGEAVKVAVRRLIPHLQTLLAAKLWRLTANEGSSLLRVKATLEILDPAERVLMQRETTRSLFPTSGRKGLLNIPLLKSNSSSSVSDTAVGIPILSIGSRIQYRIYNDSDFPVYVFLFNLDASKSAIALYPINLNDDTNASPAKQMLKDVVIAPGKTLTVPQATVDFEWVIHGPAGLAQTQIICSSASFTQTLAALEVAMQPKGKQGQIGSLVNPLEAAQAILQDLHNASSAIAAGSTSESVSSTADTYSLDVNAWASFSFIYQIV